MWVETIQQSLPEHASDITDALGILFDNTKIDEVDAHGCALSAALVALNGDLAFEIQMDGPLMGRDERKLAKFAAIKATTDSVHNNFIYTSEDLIESNPAYFWNESLKVDDYMTSKSFIMYDLSAAIVARDPVGIRNNILALKEQEVTDEQISYIAQVASIVSSINRVII